MFASINPRGPLASVVEKIWISRAVAGGQGLEWRLPTGRVELVFNLHAEAFELHGEDGAAQRYPGAVVIGPSARPFRLDIAQRRHVLGVVFRPAAARGLLSVPMRELTARHVALGDLWGEAAIEVRERVIAVSAGARRLAELERILQTRLAAQRLTPHPVAQAAVAALSDARRRKPGRLEDHLGFTRRRIEQVFQADVGMSPDAYRRLVRFRAALENIDRAERVGWARFALDLGYCDQSHLIRAFQAHAGISPELYLRRRGPEMNHLRASAD